MYKINTEHMLHL